MLSQESRNELSKLLPPTAFLGSKCSLASQDPQSADAMDVDQDLSSSDTVDPFAAFNNPHLLSAADTWQDHLNSGWLSPDHQEKIEGFLAGVRAGTLAAPWKDEVWLSEHAQAQPEPGGSSGTGAAGTHTSSLAGFVNFVHLGSFWNLNYLCTGFYFPRGAALIKMTTLVEKGTLHVGDILAYRRTFSTLGITVEKDAIVSQLHSSSVSPTQES